MDTTRRGFIGLLTGLFGGATAAATIKPHESIDALRAREKAERDKLQRKAAKMVPGSGNYKLTKDLGIQFSGGLPSSYTYPIEPNPPRPNKL